MKMTPKCAERPSGSSHQQKQKKFLRKKDQPSGFAINLIGSFKVYILFAISELFTVQASKNSRLITALLISAKNWVLASSDGSWPPLFNTWL